jgi:hypothetical protein
MAELRSAGTKKENKMELEFELPELKWSAETKIQDVGDRNSGIAELRSASAKAKHQDRTGCPEFRIEQRKQRKSERRTPEFNNSDNEARKQKFNTSEIGIPEFRIEKRGKKDGGVKGTGIRKFGIKVNRGSEELRHRNPHCRNCELQNSDMIAKFRNGSAEAKKIKP